MSECTTILQSAVDGARITPEQATLLFEKADLVDLADAADDLGGSARAILGNPLKNAIEVGVDLLPDDDLHTPKRRSR